MASGSQSEEKGQHRNAGLGPGQMPRKQVDELALEGALGCVLCTARIKRWCVGHFHLNHKVCEFKLEVV